MNNGEPIPGATPPPEANSGAKSTTVDTTNKSDMSWQERTMGLFPEGTRMRKVELDTHSKSEYGERTWTTGQTVRDILQNHLDANTQVFFEELVSGVINTEDRERIEQVLTDPQRAKDFDEFTYGLYRYKKSLPDLSDEAREEFGKTLTDLAHNLPIKPELLDERGTLTIEQVDSVIDDINERPPQVTYKVRDLQNGSEETWLTLIDLSSPQYSERVSGSDNFRYEVTACKIEDEGKGFDSKLTAYYKSTKTGKRHLRGRFGEGTKMSEAHLVRNEAEVKMRSVYQVDTEQGQRERLWQVRPFVGESGKVELKGVEVDTQAGTAESSGSFTVINIKDAREDFAQEFRRNIDPRTPEGIAANALSFANERYHYPMGVLNRDWKRPVGVCVDRANNYQYVQGLKVGEANGGYGEPIFSYDFLDSSILKGRDRSELRESLSGQIKGFWYNAESPELMRELVTKVWLEGKEKNGTPPEFEALRDFIDYDSRYLSPQEQRAQQILFDVIPELVNLREGEKHVFVSDYQSRNPENSALIRTLSNKGYRIIELQCTVVGKNIDSLNAHYGGRYDLQTLEGAREKASELVGTLGKEDERTLLAQEIYSNAQGKLSKLFESLGYPLDKLKVGDPSFVEAVDGNNQQPVELEWLPKEGKFRLVMRPEIMRLGIDGDLGKDYWERYASVFMLASLDRHEPFPDQNTLLQHAQNNAQNLLNLSIRSGQQDFDGLPENFNHVAGTESTTEALDRFIEHLQKSERQMEGWQLLRESRSLALTPEEFQQAYERLSGLPADYAQEVKRILEHRVILEEGKVYIDEQGRYGSAGRVVEKQLAELPVVAQWQNHDVVRLDERRFAVLTDIPDGSVVTMNEFNKYVYYGNTILNFERFHFGNYQFQSYPATLEKNCIVVTVDPDKQKDDLVANINSQLQSIEISSSDVKIGEELRQLSGTIDTPLPVEYGQSEWDNPIRVFQDIIQNHLDASPNRKGVTLQYEVNRSGQRAWVTEDGLNESDTITGLTILDAGSGYSPNELGTMGNSSKKSPLFSGKYGEGQKMIAAAAARNGLQLFYSSIGSRDGKQYRWTANVATRTEALVVEGKQTQTDRVIFQQESKALEENRRFTSSTTLRLPENAAQTQQAQWGEWVKIIDPRVKDKRGNGGLGRYVIDLRRGDNPDVIDLGYMRILLDEPGAIYENGLLISYEKTDTDRTVVGYDVPEVVNTRERNSYDRRKLETYIGHAIMECPDKRLSERLVTEFRDKYLNKAREEGDMPYITQQDLNVGSILMFERGINPSRPFWDQANREILGGYIVHSDESLRKRIKFRRDDLSGKRGYVMDKEKGERELEQLLSTMANIRHIPKDRILNVSERYYDGWAKILPTAESYISTLNQDAVSTTPETASALRDLVANSASVIKDRIDPLLEGEGDASLTLDAIVSGKKPANIDDWVARMVRNQSRDALQKWTDRQALESNPDSVFVAPVYAGYLGIAQRDRIGFNERLLVTDDSREIAGVSRHELVHKIFGIRDYTPEFIMLLHKLSESGVSA